MQGRVFRKGEAFPQIRRRSRRSSLTGPSAIWTGLGGSYASMILLRMAKRTRSLTEDSPSLCIMLAR